MPSFHSLLFGGNPIFRSLRTLLYGLVFTSQINFLSGLYKVIHTEQPALY